MWGICFGGRAGGAGGKCSYDARAVCRKRADKAKPGVEVGVGPDADGGIIVGVAIANAVFRGLEQHGDRCACGDRLTVQRQLYFVPQSGQLLATRVADLRRHPVGKGGGDGVGTGGVDENMHVHEARLPEKCNGLPIQIVGFARKPHHQIAGKADTGV